MGFGMGQVSQVNQHRASMHEHSRLTGASLLCKRSWNAASSTPAGQLATKDAKIDLHGLPVEVAKVAVQAGVVRLSGDNGDDTDDPLASCSILCPDCEYRTQHARVQIQIKKVYLVIVPPSHLKFAIS